MSEMRRSSSCVVGMACCVSCRACGCGAWTMARGTHAVVRMADIVRRMVDDGVPERQIRKRLGMEAEEVIRLVNRAGMPGQVRKVAPAFNKAWVPGKG